jgi:hypothetical protein
MVIAFCVGPVSCVTAADAGFQPLFSEAGVPEGWLMRAWDDVRNPAHGNPVWQVEDGVLCGGEPRGSWLLSERDYGDFLLDEPDPS